ncbi:hypothetical protein ACHAXS_010073 [Conticribra weissflogii]
MTMMISSPLVLRPLRHDKSSHCHRDCRMALSLSRFLALLEILSTSMIPSAVVVKVQAFQFHKSRHPYPQTIFSPTLTLSVVPPRLPCHEHARRREYHLTLSMRQQQPHHHHYNDEIHRGDEFGESPTDDTADPQQQQQEQQQQKNVEPSSSSADRRHFLTRTASTSIAAAMGIGYSTFGSFSDGYSYGYGYDGRRRHYYRRCCLSHHVGFNCYTTSMLTPSANAMENEIFSTPSSFSSSPYDAPRNQLIDSFFSWNTDTTMEGYEQTVRPYKEKLFQSLFRSLSENYQNERNQYVPTIVELGMGTFPNAPYYAQAISTNADDDNRNNDENGRKAFNFQALQIIGVDPNDSMARYAMKNAERGGLLVGKPDDNNYYQSKDNDGIFNNNGPNKNIVSVRTIHGVAEALPFPDDSIDAIVATLTLCSVSDPERALSEIRRVLKKPKSNVERGSGNDDDDDENNNGCCGDSGGKYLFWEHVQSETDSGLAMQQTILTPLQSFLGDGCHLNRRTGESIRNAGFDIRSGMMEYVEFEQFGLIGPTVMGIVSV